MKRMKQLIFITFLMITIDSCVWDPLYSLHLINKSDRQIIYKVKEERPNYMLDFKLSDIDKMNRIESDSSFVRHYSLKDTFYTEIKLNPNELVSICGGVGNYPRHINSEIYEIIVNQDTLKLTGGDIVKDMIQVDKRRFIYEFKY